MQHNARPTSHAYIKVGHAIFNPKIMNNIKILHSIDEKPVHNSFSFSDRFASLIDEAGKAHDVSLSSTIGEQKWRLELLKKIIKDAEKRSRFRNILAASTAIVPVLGLLLGLFGKHLDTVPLLIIWIAYTCVFITIYLCYQQMPKDDDAMIAEARQMQLSQAARALAAQVALHNTIEEVDHDDNNAMIARFGTIVDTQVLSAVNADLNRVQRVSDQAKSNQTFSDSLLYVKDVHLQNKTSATVSQCMDFIAQTLHEACTVFFNHSGLTVKIYLRTKHKIPLQSSYFDLEVLTCFAKYPGKGVHVPSSSGKSWIKCRGACARAWYCLQNGEKFIIRKNEPKGSGGIHASIIYLALPGGIGVLTISSDNEDTFDNTVSTDIQKTLMIATRALISRV